MADPTLKRVSVKIAYTGSDGYRSEAGYSHSPGKGTPEGVLLDAIEEMARLTALFLLEDEANRRIAAAQFRVREWRQQRGGGNG